MTRTYVEACWAVRLLGVESTDFTQQVIRSNPYFLVPFPQSPFRGHEGRQKALRDLCCAQKVRYLSALFFNGEESAPSSSFQAVETVRQEVNDWFIRIRQRMMRFAFRECSQPKQFASIDFSFLPIFLQYKKWTFPLEWRLLRS